MSPALGPECPGCMDKLLVGAVRLCGLPPREEEDLSGLLLERCRAALFQGQAPAVAAGRLLGEMCRQSGQPDPFLSRKRADQAAAAQAVRRLGPVPADFRSRARAAVAGNALDHFINDNRESWKRGQLPDLGLDHTDRALNRLRPGAEVVILADNAGEEHFDRLLATHLLDRGCRVFYVVKSAPVQNDLTLADLPAGGGSAGLGRVVGSGTAQVGLDPGETPLSLRRLLDRASLVIAKGMGHYETLHPRFGLWPGGRLRWPVLFLFMAKCAPIARTLGVARGTGIALFCE